MPLTQDPVQTDWARLADQLAASCAARAAEHDQNDRFVSENVAELKAAGAYGMHIPAELGGGGATYEETADFLRRLAHGCGSSALALSMHTHLVATTTWRYRNQAAPVGPFLSRVASEGLVLVSSGGSDWLNGSATAIKTDGGFLVSGRKIFASGSPVGDLLMTTAVYQDPESGPTVLHFPVNLRGEGVSSHDTWRTLGMRGTGSNDLQLENVFVPEASVAVRRPQGKWHPAMHLVASVAMPLIYAVYVGLAEAARKAAIALAEPRSADPDIQVLAGEMDTELASARLALDWMVRNAVEEMPGNETTNKAMMGRQIAGRSALRVAELAMEVAGGASFFRAKELERIFRDIQAARFHPLREMPQKLYAGRMALAMSVDA